MKKGQVRFYSLRLTTTNGSRITFNFITVDGIKNSQKNGMEFFVNIKKEGDKLWNR